MNRKLLITFLTRYICVHHLQLACKMDGNSSMCIIHHAQNCLEEIKTV